MLDTFDAIMDVSKSDCSNVDYIPNAFNHYNTSKPFIGLYDTRDIRNRSEVWESVYKYSMDRVTGYDTLEQA